MQNKSETPPQSKDRFWELGTITRWLALLGVLATLVVVLLKAIIPNLPSEKGTTLVAYPGETIYVVWLTFVTLTLILLAVWLTCFLLHLSTHKNHADFRRIHSDLEQLFKGMRGPYLMSWDESGENEKRAQSVLCITKDLMWAKKNIDVIIQDAIQNKNHTYHYIVFDDQDANQLGKANAKDIQKAVSEAEPHARNKKLLDRIVIKFLDELPSREAPFNSPPSLPLPSDMVLYEAPFKEDNEGTTSFLVASGRSWMDGVDARTSFDLVIRDERMWKTFKVWFSETWGLLDPFS